MWVAARRCNAFDAALVASVPRGHLTGVLRGIGARFTARRASNRGNSESAEAAFAAAARIHRGIATPFRLAVGLLEHAEWLASNARSDEARPLVEAKEIFRRLAAAPWSKRADDLAEHNAVALSVSIPRSADHGSASPN